MSSAATTESIPRSASTSKSKKSTRKKKPDKNKAKQDESKSNGSKHEAEPEDEEEGDLEEETYNEAGLLDSAQQASHKRKSSKAVNGVAAAQDVSADLGKLRLEDSSRSSDAPDGSHPEPPSAPSVVDTEPEASNGDTEAKLEALAKERSALRDEVTQLRRSLEELQGKQNEELANLRQELEETRGEKENADTQYRNLLGRVNTIKSQLGERLKADAEELAQARSHIEQLEETNAALKSEGEARVAEIHQLGQDGDERSKELSTLRNRLNLSQQNWTKEREDLVQRESFAREEFESAKQAMQDWEVLAMEERSIRENLGEKVAELEEQVGNLREGNQSLESERSTQAMNIDGLQRALKELQETRKQELRELVENSQTLRQQLEKQLQEAQETSNKATSSLESTQKELERLLPLESEVKEKSLLIGKLRHEAVILNDHLTKALKQLKKGKPEDTIDRALVTNHFLHFLQLERSDPKKFQVLQIMASLLGWSDEQREQAGLARPGASNPNLRTPISPWHRTPSTPSLSTDFLSPQPTPQTGKDSLAGMFSDFLENEASSGGRSGRGSRSTSVSSSRR